MAAPAFLHGVEVLEQDIGARPIREIATGVIGLVGTARTGPAQTPTLIAGSRREATEQFGSEGTIPRALAGILDQVGAPVVVVNTLERTAVAQEAVAFVGDVLELGPRRSDAQLADVVIETAGAMTATVGISALAAPRSRCPPPRPARPETTSRLRSWTPARTMPSSRWPWRARRSRCRWPPVQRGRHHVDQHPDNRRDQRFRQPRQRS